MSDAKWIRVTRKKHCPICGRPDWCSVSADGQVVICMRTESEKPCKSGGWFHRLTEPVPYRPEPPRKKIEPVPVKDFAALSQQCVERLQNISILAESLSVSPRSLERLEVGWNGQGHTFPMRDGQENVIGIRVRAPKGKWCIPGSHNGLFWPEGVYAGSNERLFICEGPTDCAALLTMEFCAIGRPSCSGGVEHIVEFLRGKRRDVVIMADRDPPKHRPDGSVWFPGQEGAARLAQAIRPFVRTLKVIKPPFHKDVRDWHKAGATHDVVETLIRNVRFVA